MRKRMIALLLCTAALLSIFGCGGGSSDEGTGLFYYYRPEPDYESPDPMICPEERDLSAYDSLDDILKAYLAGPLDPALQVPFPRDTRILGWSLRGGTLLLDFSGEFALLSGVELSVACGCVAQTFLELTEAERVVITAGGALLDGENTVTMTRQTLLLRDDSLDRLVSAHTLYYTDAARRYLIGREVSVNLASLDDVESYLVQQLLSGDPGADLVSPLPAGTRLLGVQVEDGLCTVNFSREFESNCWSSPIEQRLTLMSVVNTLTQLETISRVEFAVDGNLLLHYGLLSIPEPLQRDKQAIGPVRTAVGEFDATLYLANGDDHLLLPVPTRIRQSAGVSQAELIVQTLLQYEPRNGLTAGNAGGCYLRSIEVTGGICTVDLSAEVLSAPDQFPLIARSLTASLCALEDIQGVQLRVEGAVPAELEGRWFDVLTPESDWFL